MKYKFWKYQGTGNDFILFDGRYDVSKIKGNKQLIAHLCDRRFGIGADGLIILEPEDGVDFRMVYYNSDGGESTMCGNGGRCSIAFAVYRGLASNKTNFQAVDGPHDGAIVEGEWVELGMINVEVVEKLDEYTYKLDTGSPHYVRILKPSEDLDIKAYGSEIRYSKDYLKEGINVNTLKEMNGRVKVETYERGVEDETYSCGTGVTACAIVYNEYKRRNGVQKVDIITKGGELSVSFVKNGLTYENIVLAGPANLVYEGEIEI